MPFLVSLGLPFLYARPIFWRFFDLNGAGMYTSMSYIYGCPFHLIRWSHFASVIHTMCSFEDTFITGTNLVDFLKFIPRSTALQPKCKRKSQRFQ